jgi:transposase
MRHRNDMVMMASEHIQHMQKALTQMNVQFQHVISDLTGLTGLAVLDALVAGERDPEVLAKLRDPHIKASEETIRKSLEGNWRAEHILALKQRVSLYRSHRDLIDECDREIEKLVAAFEPRVDPQEKPMPEDRKQKQRKRRKKGANPDFNMRAEAYKLFGVDLTQIPGLMTLVFMLFSEVGRDMSRWPTAAHFVSWLGLCPDNDISGGKVLWRGARRTKNRAGTLFRLAAHSLHHDRTPMGDYLRRMKAKLGPAAATTATAHKIAIIFYTMVSRQVEYDPSLWANRDQMREKRLEARLQKQAAQRGYKLVPLESAA